MKPKLKPVDKPLVEQWVKVEGKPHLWRDLVSGRMKYTPPDPTQTWPVINYP